MLEIELGAGPAWRRAPGAGGEGDRPWGRSDGQCGGLLAGGAGPGGDRGSEEALPGARGPLSLPRLQEALLQGNVLFFGLPDEKMG